MKSLHFQNDNVGKFLRLEVCKFWNNPLLRSRTQIWGKNNDIIFPSVIDMGEILGNPLDKFYMYFAPHDTPGGIGLATASNPLGPWKKYERNPILERNNRNSNTAHISSPHVIWNPYLKCFFMYYHGMGEWDNQKAEQTTGFAISDDGIKWKKTATPVIDSKNPNAWDGNELSYARVTILKKDYFVMFYMGRDIHRSAPKLGLALSQDGIKWQKNSQPFLFPSSVTQKFISTGHLVEYKKFWLLFYVDETTKAKNSMVHLAISSDNGRTWQGPFRVLSPGRWYQWDCVRVHDPFVFIKDDKIYLYYAGGPRRKSKGVGVANLKIGDNL